MVIKKKTWKLFCKRLIPGLALLILASLVLHLLFYTVPVPHVTFTFGVDFVEVQVSDRPSIPQFNIEKSGIPGVVAFYESYVLVAFVNSENYLAAKVATPITLPPDENGLIISCTPAYVTSGPYVCMPYELTGQREHTPDSDGKLFIINVSNDSPFYQKNRRIII